MSIEFLYRDDEPPISAAQCRGARAMLGVSQGELAKLSKVSEPTIANFERGATTPQARTLNDLKVALEGMGIRFIFDATGQGVVLAHPSSQDEEQ